MSKLQLSRSPDLKRLRDEGYDIDVREGVLAMRDVPYVNSQRQVKRGILVSPMKMAGDIADKPDDHQTWFVGDHPCNPDGSIIKEIAHGTSLRDFGEGLVAQHDFSARPKEGTYPDYYVKMTTYERIISSRARAIDPRATAKTFPLISADEDDPIFAYHDTASSRANIMAATRKLRDQRIALIGCGGTGSYILDYVSKTPVREIHLYDDDVFSQHNAFRTPGAASREELEQKPSKVAYLAAKYSKMHLGITPHEAKLDEHTAHELANLTFAFVCVDKGEARRFIIEKLLEHSVPLIDVGMGLSISGDAIKGMVRVTTVTPGKHDHVERRISFEDLPGHDLYDRNIQVAELNALNAAYAVLKWKKLCGFYVDGTAEHHLSFCIDTNLLLSRET